LFIPEEDPALRTFPVFALLFFVVPLVEIYFLVQVGQVIGAFPTILLVVFTAVLGAFLLRQQGLSTFVKFQRAMAQGEVPATAMLEGLILLVGGLLLMTPGFVTDTIGFLCLIPFTRAWIVKGLSSRFQMHVISSSSVSSASTGFHYQQGSQPGQDGSGNVVEGEYTRKE